MATLHARVKMYCTRVDWPPNGEQSAVLVAVADPTIPAPQQIAGSGTPQSELHVTVSNAALNGMFTLGSSYTVDISPA